MGVSDFRSFQSVEAAERAAKAESELELRHAINNHADNLTNLNDGYGKLFALVQKQADQIEVILDSLRQMTTRLEALEQRTHG